MRFFNAPVRLKQIAITAQLGAALALFIVHSPAFPRNSRHFAQSPNAELVIRSSTLKKSVIFPVTLPGLNEPENLEKTLPVFATPLKLVLNRYLPALGWKTTVIDKPGHIVAEISAKGPELKKHFRLDTSGFDRRSSSSPIGTFTLLKISNADRLEHICSKSTEPDCLGLVSVRSEQSGFAFELPAFKDRRFSIPVLDCNLSILRFVPHFNFDTRKKKVTSLSENPVNPAVKVKLDYHGQTLETWLWSKFPSFSHRKEKLPLSMHFTHFNFKSGNYYILTAFNARPRLIYAKKDRTREKPLAVGKTHNLDENNHSFIIENIYHNAAIKYVWSNSSKKNGTAQHTPENPALIVTLKYNDISEQLVLEKNKAEHIKTPYGPVSLLYR